MLVAKIKRDASQGSADVMKWFTFFSTDVIELLQFGDSLNMLETEKVSDPLLNHSTVCHECRLRMFIEKQIHAICGHLFVHRWYAGRVQNALGHVL